MGVAATMKVEAYLSGAWTEITADTKAAAGLSLKYGIDGNGPTDSYVASPGELSFTLRNDAGGSGGVTGYYSPRHASVRTGWGFGVPVRVRFTSSAVGITDKVKFRGKVATIDPDPGLYGPKSVRVTAYDGIYDLLHADARELALTTDSDESTLIGAVLDAIPAAAQPVARSLDTGIELFPVVFDKLQGGQKALKVIADLATSALGRVFITGDGTFRYQNRHNWGPLNTSAVTLTNTMQGFVAPTSVDRLINRVRITTHGKRVSAAATDLLFDLPAGTVQLGAGETREIWCDYTDPDDRQTKVGGADVVTTLVAGTHYAGNAAEDGAGADLTATLSATLTAFSSTAKFVVTNSGTLGAWLRLRIYGRAVRDEGPTVSESASTQVYGERVASLDMPYQSSLFTGASVADYLEGAYASLTNQMDEIEFIANENATFMEQALNREPGDLITVTETVTGYSSVAAIIQSIAFEVTPPCWIRCRWTLAPASTLSTPWLLGTSALNSTTVLGF